MKKNSSKKQIDKIIPFGCMFGIITGMIISIITNNYLFLSIGSFLGILFAILYGEITTSSITFKKKK